MKFNFKYFGDNCQFSRKINIQFINDYFGYQKDHLVLRNINFNIKENNKVAFVGGSGNGKSTIMDLFLRLYNPNSGHITIGGIPIETFSENFLRKNLKCFKFIKK